MCFIRSRVQIYNYKFEEVIMEYAIHLFNAGGVVMYPLVLFMLAACTILFERIRMYRRIDSEIQQLSSSIEAGRNAIC